MQNSVKNILQNKRFLKLFSLFAAMSLWLFVTSSRPISREETVPLKILLPDDQCILEESSPLEVAVKFQGARIYLQTLQIEYSRPVINLLGSEFKDQDEIELEIKQSDFNTPFGVSVVDFQPKTFKIKIDKKIYKKVEVRPVYQNKIDEGLKLIEQKITPNEVLLEGPQEILKSIDVVLTQSIDLSGLKGQGEFPVPLDHLPKKVQIKSLDVHEIKFQYDIRPVSSNIEFKNVKIRFLTSVTNFHSDHYFINLIAQIPKDFPRIDKSEIQVVADIPEGAKGEMWIDLKAILPKGVQLLELRPSKIFVKVK